MTTANKEITPEQWERQLTSTGRRLAAVRARQKSMLELARQAAVEADKAGVPQTVIARSLGINRMTVRDWFGQR